MVDRLLLYPAILERDQYISGELCADLTMSKFPHERCFHQGFPHPSKPACLRLNGHCLAVLSCPYNAIPQIPPRTIPSSISPSSMPACYSRVNLPSCLINSQRCPLSVLLPLLSPLPHHHHHLMFPPLSGFLPIIVSGSPMALCPDRLTF